MSAAWQRLGGVLLLLAVGGFGSGASHAQEVAAEEPNRGGSLSYEARDPEVAKQRLHLPPGYQIELFASERDFPLGNPVAMAFDGRGRLWVSTMPSYPQRVPDREPDDKIVILEDRDGDGRADHHTVFAEGLHLPAGLELGDGGAYVAQQPDLVFLADSDGDDRADRREVVLHGFGTEDSHHAISAFTWGPAGGLYFQEGTFHHSQVETPWGPVRLVNAGVFRYEPLRHWLEVFVSYPFANPWGHVFDAWGQNFIADASGGANYFGTAITGAAPYPLKRRPMKVFTSVVRPTAGCEIVSSRHFPDEAQGNFLVNNTIGFQGIKQHRMLDEGSGFTSEEVEPLLYSTDINFRPVDIEFGPDGALYIVDWFNPLIGHMQYSLRDERRDSGHGRIWRITYPSRPLVEVVDVEEASIDELVRLLDAPEDRTRYRVRRELRVRDRDRVLSAAREWLAGVEAGDSPPTVLGVEHARLEVLWLHQSLAEVDADLLRRVLASPEPRARAAATRVLRFWRDRLPDPVGLLAGQVHDDSARVRLEALLGLSYLPSLEASRAAVQVLDHETDYYLDYVLGETVDTLAEQWRPALEDGSLLASLNAPAAEYLLSRLATDELDALDAVAARRTVLARRDATPDMQQRALTFLSEVEATSVAAEAVAALERADADASVDARLLPVLGDLVAEQPSAALGPLLDRLVVLARDARRPETREAAFAALIEEDRDRTLVGRSASVESRVAWLRALRRARPELRQQRYEGVLALASAGSASASGLALTEAALEALAGMPARRDETLALLVDASETLDLRSTALMGAGELLSGGGEPSWSLLEAEPARLLADRLGQHLIGLEVQALNTPATRAHLDLGRGLVERLPSDQAATLRDVLDSRDIQVVELRPVPHQMLFDRKEIVVEAGRPVEIVFVNVDVMPHNVVVGKTGSLEDLGRLAEAQARDNPREAEARGYVPGWTDKVLFATRMVQPGDRAALSFVAPAEQGLYPFVCTFPGHWILMNGILRVVAPGDAPAAVEPPPPRIETTRNAPRRFVEDWTLEQLEAPARALTTRDDAARLARGRTLFADIGCAQCHQLGGEGGDVGPALDDVAERFDSVETLRHVLDPSATVDEQYETVIVRTRDGRVLTGLVASEDDRELRLRSNPLAPEDVLVVARDDIESVSPSALSPMPSGLLTTLTQDEVMDLLGYLRSSH
jgi:putative heme-binding domain-containing protein